MNRKHKLSQGEIYKKLFLNIYSADEHHIHFIRMSKNDKLDNDEFLTYSLINCYTAYIIHTIIELHSHLQELMCMKLFLQNN